VDVRIPDDVPDVHSFVAGEERMSTHGIGSGGHQVGSTKLFVTVWLWLAAVTGIEVFLGYVQLQPTLMLSLLVILSVCKAALIVAYFMHLKYERFSLTLALIPATIFCITMMLIFFFPDSMRILRLGTGAP
jgi:cytochrome c oxidase subunit 4